MKSMKTKSNMIFIEQSKKKRLENGLIIDEDTSQYYPWLV